MKYVITCGDDGVQINTGRRLGVVGAGVKLDNFSQLVKGLKKTVGRELYFAASAENDWIKQQFDLNDYEQADATMQQQVEALADREGIKYAGFLPFADPQELLDGVRGHMVRPKGVHIANKIAFTLAGGEQVYNLGNFLVSAEWVSAVPLAVAKQILQDQIDFYTKLAKQPLSYTFEKEGELGAELAESNLKVLTELGIK